MSARSFAVSTEVIGACLHEGNIGLQFGPELWAFPVQKVHKRLKNGPEDNITSFYKVMIGSLSGAPDGSQ